MKRILLLLVERLRVDLLDIHDALDAEDVDGAIEAIATVRGRLDAAVEELRA